MYQPRPQSDPNGGHDRGERGHDDDRKQQLDGRKDAQKLKNDKPKGNQKPPELARCFRCTEMGHHQLDCTNDPICYKCKQPRHMAVECSTLLSRKLKMYGFGVPGLGFYSIDIPDAEKVNKFGGLITVLDGEASEDKLDKELKNLVNPKWDFQIKELSSQEFGVSFPDQNSLDTFSKFTGVELALYGLKVKISKS